MFAQKFNPFTGCAEWVEANEGSSQRPYACDAGQNAVLNQRTRLLSGFGMPNMVDPADESSVFPGLADSLYLDMLTDRRRNCAYAACLQAVVQPGMHETARPYSRLAVS